MTTTRKNKIIRSQIIRRPAQPDLQLLRSGLKLMTRDGRKIGNAIITKGTPHPRVGTAWHIETDFGNTAVLTAVELAELFFVSGDDAGARVCSVSHWRAERSARQQEAINQEEA